MTGRTIHAAGGIVVRNGARPQIAIVQRSKDKRWVLPRGKLKRNERPVDAARREVVEETGFRVHVDEFVGAITYRANGGPKVVQFWSMQAAAQRADDVAKDIASIAWLSLAAAVERLSFPLEKAFLDTIGRQAIMHCKRRRRPKVRAPSAKVTPRRRRSSRK